MAKAKQSQAASEEPKKVSGLAGLLAAGRAHEEQEREANSGFVKSYVQIVTDPKDKELKPEAPEFIKGAKYLHFIMPNRKLTLGANPVATVVGMFKVYEEREIVPPGTKELPKLLSVWHPLDAEQVKLDGSFDRPFKAADGKMHVLRPVHWLFVWFEKHPDIQDGLITFKSKGNAIYQSLVKSIKNSGVAYAPQLKLKMKTQEIPAKEYNTSYLYPDFEILPERNFEIKNVKGEDTPVECEGGLPEEQIEIVLGLYAQLAKEYAEFAMVSRKRDLTKLLGSPSAPAAALGGKPTKGGGATVEDEDDETF